MAYHCPFCLLYSFDDCFFNALAHYSFPVDYHSTSTTPWIVDVVGNMVAETGAGTVADLFFFPP